MTDKRRQRGVRKGRRPSRELAFYVCSWLPACWGPLRRSRPRPSNGIRIPNRTSPATSFVRHPDGRLHHVGRHRERHQLEPDAHAGDPYFIVLQAVQHRRPGTVLYSAEVIYDAPPAPTLTSLSPSSGPVATAVTISGGNF